MKHRSTFALMIIVLIAAAFRLVELGSVPPGLQHDEVFHAHDAFTVREGYTPLWFSSNAGNEPLYIYLMALSTALVGDNVLGIRLTAVLCGLLTVVFSTRWAHLAFGRRTALIVALLLAVSFWPVWMSRVGLRVVSLPPLVALFGWLYTRALDRASGEESKGLKPPVSPSSSTSPGPFVFSSSLTFAWAGLALGLTLYTYPAAFAVPLALAAFYAYAAICRREIVRRAPFGHLILWITATLIAMPLGLALRAQEGGYLRVQQTAIPLQALREGDLLPLLDATWRTLGMWFYRGDPLWRYNIAGRPVFNPVLAAFLVLGFGALVKASLSPPQPPIDASGGGRRVAWALIPLLMLIGMLPSAVTDSPPAFLRASVTLSPAFIAVAVGLDLAGRRLQTWIGHGNVLSPLVGLMAAMAAVETAYLYFAVWPNNAEVQRVYRSDLAQVAAYLEQHTPPGSVAISTSEPHHLDRFIFDYTPHGHAAIHWFDGLNALVAPAGEAEAWLFVTREPVPGPRIQHLLDQLPLVEERRFVNGELAFALYAIPPGDAFYAAFPPPVDRGVWVADPLAFPPDDPDGIRIRLSLPVQFGDVVQLVGYEAASVGRGGTWYPLVLYWRATRDVLTPEPWAIFAHLLNPQGELMAGRDFLAVPASTWRAGDIFIQTHDIALPDGLPPGRYHLEIGLYTQTDGSRFPIMANGVAVGNRLLLEPVKILSAP